MRRDGISHSQPSKESTDRDGDARSLCDEALRLLRQSGGRITASRRAVVEVLLENGAEHITAEELAWRVRRRHPDIHRATVYRSLERLQDAGIITHVHIGHGPSTFHLTNRPHDHVACRSCGTIIELASDALDGVAARLRAEHGWQLTSQHFALSALCPACT